MKFEVEYTANFGRELKKLLKKYHSLKLEISDLIEDLEINPRQGIALGNNCYKIRLAISSKGKGKSGGARVITHIFVEEEKVYLLSIFDKSERENISDTEILAILKNFNNK